MDDDFNEFNLDDILGGDYSLDDILGEAEDMNLDLNFDSETDAPRVPYTPDSDEQAEEQPKVDIKFKQPKREKKDKTTEEDDYSNPRNLKRLEKERRREEKQRIQDQEELEKERRKEEKQRIRAQGKTKRTVRLVVGLVFLTILVAGMVLGGIKVSESETILPNIYVGDISVGRLTREQATEKLEQGGWRERTENPLVVTSIGGVTAELSPTDAGADLTIEQAVEASYKYGHIGNIIENLATYIETTVRPVNINTLYRNINDQYIDSAVSGMDAAVKEYMEGEEYTVDQENSVLRMKKGWGNLELNTDALKNAIITALENGDSQLDFTIVKNAPAMPDFAAIHSELAAEPADAFYSDDGKFEVTDEIVGCEFDVSQAQTIWNAAQPGEEISIPLEITYPEVTGDDLRAGLYCHLLGAMTTRYTNSAENRCSNVRLACSKINGLVLYPGEEFSFNEFIGARTEEAGFLPAPAYAAVGEDGVKDEIGGGCCQVSSTLYAASLFSFLETVERHNHVYAVNYIQLGTDATVTIPEEGNEMDFKFKNSRAYPIKIVGYTNETEEEKSITIEIWGTLEADDYMPIEFDNSYSWTFDYDRVIEPADVARPGYKIKLTHETYSFSDDIGPGYRTITHREVYDSDGNMVSDEIINPEISTGPAMDTYYHHNQQ